MFNKYYFAVYVCVLSTLLLAEEQHLISYNLEEGPNLISFPIISNNSSIDIFFTLENEDLLSNYEIDPNIISVITEDALSYNNNSNWVGSLDAINTDNGYWVIIDEPVTFLFLGDAIDSNIYLLHPGSNLISYPFSVEQSTMNALNTFSTNMIYAILGQDAALLSINDSWYGSLQTFEPGKGYWFIVSDYTPFVYNVPSINVSSESQFETLDNEDFEPSYNQSTLQSIFFIESIYHSGLEVSNEVLLNVYCNDTISGQRIWNSNFTDIIVMGYDGYEQTSGYCENNQHISIDSSDNIDYFFLKGNNQWIANNFNINILSDTDFGDLNFNNILNITDIIIMLEHVLEINEFQNTHQNLLADINQDSTINIADIIINIENILNN